MTQNNRRIVHYQSTSNPCEFTSYSEITHTWAIETRSVNNGRWYITKSFLSFRSLLQWIDQQHIALESMDVLG